MGGCGSNVQYCVRQCKVVRLCKVRLYGCVRVYHVVGVLCLVVHGCGRLC